MNIFDVQTMRVYRPVYNVVFVMISLVQRLRYYMVDMDAWHRALEEKERESAKIMKR